MKREPLCTYLETAASVRRQYLRAEVRRRDPLRRSSSRVRSTRAAIALLALTACSSSDETSLDSPAINAADLELRRSQLTGEQLFSQPFPGAGNERSCATCHVPEDNFALTPDHVARVFAENPNDPLFAAIDADDPAAEPLTFEHLKKGLVRVWLTLPDNVDLIDEGGTVITPSARTIDVWRSVPSIADSALTAPYQLDGRVATLEEQAQGAITGHSEGGARPRSELERIAAYERSVFSSDRAREIAQGLADGVPFDNVTKIVDSLQLAEQETRGRDIYEKVCASCHGGANTATIVDREIHEQAFFALKSDGSGNVQYQVPATDPPSPVLASQPQGEFLNITLGYEMYLATLGAKEEDYLTKNLEFPYYRFRFYADASREVIVADLPPAAGDLGFDPSQGGGLGEVDGPAGPAGGEADADGNPITGPNGGFQTHSVDPGRAIITGNPLDFESFDVPSLRGISNTSPYFHNNLVSTLEEVVQLYSDHLLSRWPQLVQPGEKEADDDGDAGPLEALTLEQKSDLVAFLKLL
jgi:cytochrome c peroxidase